MKHRRQERNIEEVFILTLSRYVNDQSSNFCIRRVNNFTIWFEYDQVKKYYGLKRTVQQFCRLLASWEWKLQDSGFWSHNQLKFDIVSTIAEIIPPNAIRMAAEMAEHQAFTQRFAMARGRSKSPSSRSTGSSSGTAPWSWTNHTGSIAGSTDGHSSTSKEQPAYRPQVMGSPHLGHVAYGGAGYGFHPSSPNIRPTYELYQPGQMQAYMMNQFDPPRRIPSQASSDAAYSPSMSSYYAGQPNVHTAQTNVPPERGAPLPLQSRPPQQQTHHQHQQQAQSVLHAGRMPPSQVPTHDVHGQNPEHSAFISPIKMSQPSPNTQSTQYQLPGPLPVLFSQQPFAMGVLGVQPGVMLPSNAAGQQTARPRYGDFEPPMEPHQVVTPMMSYQPMPQPPAGPYFPRST